MRKNMAYKEFQAMIAAATQPEPVCSQHTDAPHGFARDASHAAGKYVCECEGWEPEQSGDINEMARERIELIEAINRCYKMPLSEPDTKGALFKAENIMREAIAEAKGNTNLNTN